MKAYIFSIGETTTDLCVSQLKKMGFEVHLLHDKTSLWSKLKQFYQYAYEDADDSVLRVDADIIPNQNVLELIKLDDGCWWHQSLAFDFYRQDLIPASVSHMRFEAIKLARENIDRFEHDSRPETAIYRLEEFHYPRRCHIANIVTGLHGYGQADQRERIKQLKHFRGQEYDWDLVARIEAIEK